MRRLQPKILSTASFAVLAAIAVPGTAAWAQTPGADVTREDIPEIARAECGQLPAEQVEACVARVVGATSETDALVGNEPGLPEAGAQAGSGTIVVTGSRIARPNFDALQPTVVLDSEQIEARGSVTVADALNELPSFGVPGSSPVGAGQAGSFGSGQNFVNFLGLGSQRTLVLVNGRRFVSSNTSSIFGPTAAGLQVDLNTINTKLVERVETIAISGAPIYGSDAIAGTINVILRQDYEGIDLDAQYGISDRGDAANYRFRALAGRNFADGRGNVTLAAEYNKGEGLLYNDREIMRRRLMYRDCPPGVEYDQCLYADRRINVISESGIPTVGSEIIELNTTLHPDLMAAFFFPGATTGVTNAAGNDLMFDPTGNLIAIDYGQYVGDVAAGDVNIDNVGGNGFNLNNTLQLLTETERLNLNLITQFELTDNIRLFAEGWYSRVKATNLRNQPFFAWGLFGAAGDFVNSGPFIIDINNPFLSEEQRALIAEQIETNPLSDRNVLCTFGVTAFCEGGAVGRPEQDFFYLQRANTDIYSGRASSTNHLYRIVGGADGTLDLGGREYVWELVGNYGRSDLKGNERQTNVTHFANALDAVRDANGNIVCRPGHENFGPSISSQCQPFNPFGTGRNSQAVLDYITTIADPRAINEQYVFTASFSGPVFTLPGGDLGFAVGYEHREETTDFDPGEAYFGGPDEDPAVDDNGDGDPTNDRVPYTPGVPILPVSGKYNTDEVFGEIRAPVISPSNGIPGVYSLELHGAARYIMHSVAGSDLTWTVEGRYAPVRDIAFRANYTRAVRAPAITELFNPSSSFFGFATDPCDSDFIDQGPAPATRMANCQAAGVPANYSQTAGSSFSYPQAVIGNPQLDNEKSKAWSVGAILSPRWVPGFRLSVDYVDVKLNNAIQFFTATNVLNACYDDPDFPDNIFCDLIRRGSDFQLDFTGSSYFNAAQYRYQGILAALDYRTETPFLGADSRVGLNMSYQYLDTLTTQATPASDPTILDGTIGYPEHSAVLTVNYENGPFNMFTQFNYTGKVALSKNVTEDFFRPSEDHYNAITYVNAGLSWNVAERMTFRIVVDNVFDTGVPDNAPGFGGINSYFSGIVGRFYRIGASVAF